ncbi:MAG: PHP domain-containing protein [Nevskiaceae bacterium]|jgi:predicted metal-dependent phosphoesterase TrpH|nr:PHP domain-containing protein [Nevskiaceae bacterium]
MDMPTSQRIDLHTHSLCSDGLLSPTALAEAAAAQGVTLFALTDHDTIAGVAECARACRAQQIRHVTGVEVTSSWRGQEIHVVGLGVDPAHPALTAHLAQVIERRRERVEVILERLRRALRLPPDDTFGATINSLPVPTRTHIARELIARGEVTSIQHAFRQWLGRGRPGYAPQQWPDLASAIAAIRASGGQAVLAHPHSYKLSSGGRRALFAEFAALGGSAAELDMPGLSPTDAMQLGELSRAHGLAGSAGSDFHEPGQAWRPLGRFAKLPAGIEPLWTRFAQTQNG